jgi:TonB family protein
VGYQCCQFSANIAQLAVWGVFIVQIFLRNVLIFSVASFLSLLAGSALAQDAQLREHAVTLLERANSVSIARPFGPYEQTITIQTYRPGQGTLEGHFSSVTHDHRSYRDEYDYGSFHLLVVVNGDMIADVGDRSLAPLEIRKLTRLNPIFHVSFDKSDIIHSIEPGEVADRPAQCIEFETIAGGSSNSNEICLDQQLGTLARVRVGSETIINSGFFLYRGAYYPAKISFETGDLRMDLEQSMKELPGPLDPNVLIPPEGAIVGHVCKAYVRPFGKFMPQPKAGERGQDVDVILHGTISPSGRILNPMIDRSARDDLNQEALQIFRSWAFTPATCDDKPIQVPVDITLHFQKR